VLTEEHVVLAGPNCVDLRPDVAARMPDSREIGVIGGRVRHRLSTPPSGNRVPLKAMLSLGWHDEPGISIEPLPTQEQLRLLYAQEYIGLMGPADPVRILDLLPVPAYRVLRPRDWELTDELCERLIALASDQV
jgi:hypothetical protein